MYARVFRFLLSGGSAAAAEYAVFVALQLAFGSEKLFISQSVSFGCGFIVSFVLNRNWVFRSNGALSKELTKYMLMAAINLVAGNVLLALLVGPAALNQYVAKFLVMAIIAGWNYLVFSRIVFRKPVNSA